MHKTTSAPTWLGVNLVKNRWIFQLLGALTTAMGGAAYAFSVFIRPLEAEFGWSRYETVSAFSVTMFVFGAVMWIGGFFVDKYGPKIVFFVGATLMVLAQMLSSRIDTVPELILAYGVVGGTGIGLTYIATTIATISRWYPEPEKRGLAIGMSVLGFGMGAVVAAPLWTAGIAAVGWRSTYVLTGCVFSVALFVIGTILRFPPSDWRFVQGLGWQPNDQIHENEQSTQKLAWKPSVDTKDFPFVEAVRTPHLWMTSLMFFLTIFGGLMAIGQIAAFARDLPPAGIGLSASAAAQVIMLQAICNGAGRPIWGSLSGKIGIKPTYAIVMALMGLAMVALSFAASFPVLVLGAVLTGFAFGGTLALNPILATAFFGPSFIGRIYGLIFFLGFGLGGLVGPITGSYIKTVTGDYSQAFFTAAGVAFIGALLAALFIPRKGFERLIRPGQVERPIPSKITPPVARA